MATPYPRVGWSLRDVAEWARLLLRSEATGEVTLTASAASTVVETTRTEFVDSNSIVTLSPKTANAASALATTYIVPAKGKFTITHANNAQTDRTFGWSAKRT